jgi:hypothetical protein
MYDILNQAINLFPILKSKTYQSNTTFIDKPIIIYTGLHVSTLSSHLQALQEYRSNYNTSYALWDPHAYIIHYIFYYIIYIMYTYMDLYI